MKVPMFVVLLVIVFVICLCETDEQKRGPRGPRGLLIPKSALKKKMDETKKTNKTPENKEKDVDGAEERTNKTGKTEISSGNSLENYDDVGSLAAHSGTHLDSSMFHNDPEVYNTYMNMLNHYNNYNSQNGTENDEMLKAILKKLLYGVPVFFGYYRVFSYLNEICATGATCSNVTVTTSVTSTKLKSSSLTETSVLTSMKTKTATSSISETATTPTTRVGTTTLQATSTTYHTNTRTLRSTITTTTTTNTKKTFTFKYSETTTTTGYSLKTRVITIPKFRRELLFDMDDDDEFIEIFPAASDEIIATYSWSKFSAVMSSHETEMSDVEDDEEWTTLETTIPEYIDQDLSNRSHFMSLEGSKSSIVDASSVSYDGY